VLGGKIGAIMIDSLLYVSRAALRTDTDGSGIEDILAVARPRNQSLGVTGALIFTNDNFAQLLEGPADAIDQLMISIGRDPRHKDVRTVREEKDVTRRFEGWHMAYNGSSMFVARHVRVLAASFDAPSEAHTARLMALMISLSRGETGDLPI
jgi:hypothetical protein